MSSRLGYKGLVLIIFGWLWMVVGAGVLANPDRHPELFHTHLPIWLRVTLWVGCGGVSLFLAWFTRLQGIGFCLLFLPPAERALSYGKAFVTGPTLVWLVAAVAWLSLAAAIAIFAAWPEPVERKHAP